MSEPSKISLNQKAWVELNNEVNILGLVERTGVAKLTTTQIRKYREPRLLTKIDEKSALPPFLAENDLAILPTSRSEFLVGHFDAFYELPNLTEQIAMPFKKSGLASLQPGVRPNSEATGILAAIDAGIFSDFIDESPTTLGVMGRMGSGNFDFKIGGYDKTINVFGSQIEIDAGIESPSSLMLVEAKATQQKTFLIRQLYYPFRTWRDRLNQNKKIRPMFLMIDNDRFSIVEYRFADANLYSSIELVKHCTYQMSESILSKAELEQLLSQPLDEIRMDVPFPQADSINRIISLLTSIDLNGGEIHKEDVATQQVFVERQTDYYANAALYLGLVEISKRDKRIVVLTSLGYKVVQNGVISQTKVMAARLLRDPIVRSVFLEMKLKSYAFSSDEIHQFAEKMMIQNNIQLAKSTISRRAQTVCSWCRWLEEHLM
jgi:hypothetical protein